MDGNGRATEPPSASEAYVLGRPDLTKGAGLRHSDEQTTPGVGPPWLSGARAVPARFLVRATTSSHAPRFSSCRPVTSDKPGPADNEGETTPAGAWASAHEPRHFFVGRQLRQRGRRHEDPQPHDRIPR